MSPDPVTELCGVQCLAPLRDPDCRFRYRCALRLHAGYSYAVGQLTHKVFRKLIGVDRSRKRLVTLAWWMCHRIRHRHQPLRPPVVRFLGWRLAEDRWQAPDPVVGKGATPCSVKTLQRSPLQAVGRQQADPMLREGGRTAGRGRILSGAEGVGTLPWGTNEGEMGYRLSAVQ